MTSTSQCSCVPLHTRSHLPLCDNDGKQGGQWQPLVFPQVVRLCVIVHSDGDVFAKGQAPLQRRRECLPKTPQIMLPEGLEELLVWCHRKGLFYVPFYLFSSPSQQQSFHQISALFVSLSWANRGRKQRSRGSGGDDLWPLKQERLASFKTQWLLTNPTHDFCQCVQKNPQMTPKPLIETVFNKVV